MEEFGFGLPPRAVGKKIGETIYSLNWLPFGGFVRLKGEELEEHYDLKSREAKRAFWAKSKKARAAVIVAGVTANFLLAVAAFTVVYAYTGIPEKTGRVKIVAITENSPAAVAGLKEGDLVKSLDGTAIEGDARFIELVGRKKGQPVLLEVFRQENNPCGGKNGSSLPAGASCRGENLVVEIVPRADPPEGEGPLGVIITDVEMVKYPLWQMPLRGMVIGFQEALAWGQIVLKSLEKMLSEMIFRGAVPQEVTGPLGIYQLTGQVARTGLINLIQFVGILSVNLAVINILPFPALDGGRLAFIVYEALTKKRPSPGFERWVNTAGMTILLFLIMLVTISDINRLVNFADLFARLRRFFPF